MNGIFLSDLALTTGGHLEGGDLEITSVSTNSRTVGEGDVYFCLRGDKFDGHDYALPALDTGAVAVVTEIALDTVKPQLIVPDARKAYGFLAMLWRQTLHITLIGVTGSNGKTTVKQLVSAICGVDEAVHSTHANDNNDIGVPQTLLGISKDHSCAVVEMGANQLGEIEWLTSIVRPTVALITNVSESHLEGFGSLDGVAREKSAIYSGLGEKGVAVINADDRYAAQWRAINQNRVTVTFGRDSNADVFAVRDGLTTLSIHHKGERVECQYGMPGQHNVINAAAAAAACIAAGFSMDQVAKGLQTVSAVPGRLNIHTLTNGTVVIDDTYNANPASCRAAIDVLQGVPGTAWLVLGDLRELGDDSVIQHQLIGVYAKSNGVNRLLAVGALTHHTVSSYGKEGKWFDSKESLLEFLQAEVVAGSGILVKGSRSMHMESIVQKLLQADDASMSTVDCGSVYSAMGGSATVEPGAVRKNRA